MELVIEIRLGVAQKNTNRRLHSVRGGGRNFTALEQLNRTSRNMERYFRNSSLFCLFSRKVCCEACADRVVCATNLIATGVQRNGQNVMWTGIKRRLFNGCLGESAPGRAGSLGYGTQHALISKDHDDRVLGGVEIQSLGSIQLWWKIVAAIGREENWNS